ncbi:unnamed protein product [Tuber melanosporum]|uniref:(Perigord truffle) hypothetical protein n=1 Tax=Tuber melanosporum (strain Mel28) TaxID=656061 RepID=D5G993_TUBMM|nr:uncharacterized protein GSTUM_00003205001 [Tuber melanosporum]CAZ81086.1 unnamed protein product [Tuber melanosporum]
MSSTNRGQSGQADGLNLQHFATSTDEDSLYVPTAADQDYTGFQRYPGYGLDQQRLEDIRRSTSPHLQASTLPPSQHPSSGRQDYSDFSLYPSSTDPALFDYENKEGLTSGSINPADLISSAHSAHSSQHNTPPLHIHPNQQQSSQPDSATFLSLGPTNPSPGSEWDPVFAHQESTWNSHRKTPSEYSEISSAAASPFLQNSEFPEHSSPLLQGSNHPQQGSMQDFLNSNQDFNPGGDSFGLDQFSLNERDVSPHVSPRVSPVPGQLNSGSNSPYMLPQENQYLSYVPPMSQDQGMGLMQPQHPPAGHGLGVDSAGPGEEGPFPQINVIFAPPQRQPTFPGKPGFTHDDSALSPPPKSPQRKRSKSDPFSGSSSGGSPITRPMAIPSGSQSPVGNRSRRNSLSPVDVVTAPVGSPGAASSASSAGKISRRSSTNSLPNRDYFLGLACPGRPGNAASEKRVQKHPATFQCTLCPKRFTRAYNLRSHLRTHTDERPFVCTICGKAFARQHDRKRHEGLHSGEKKFVCRGNLKPGGAWGCGRRFARADALGRHFRSEAGRVCIRPLLEEETAERQRNQMLAQGQMLDPTLGHLSGPSDQQGIAGPSSMDPVNGMVFPSALLEQYPALANMEWGNMASGEQDDIAEGEGSNRSSFDASGGEWDEASASGGSALASHRNSYDGSRGDWSGNEEWASDTGGEYHHER